MKPSIPKGTRDFSPIEVANRTYIKNTIINVFETFGFQPIETPSFENSSTLMGKYGEEGDRLIFKILNSGDYLAKSDEKLLLEKNSAKLTPQISEKALRYDLTVPFARFVVQHQNEIDFPFKRYQVQTVWRADRPQKGRFREFFQCDADVIGSKSLLLEVDFIQLYDKVFSKLGLINTNIKINNRKILFGIAEVIGEQDKLIDFTIALDKLDKIGKDGVVIEMLSKGISEEAILKVQPLFDFSGSNQDKLSSLEKMLQTSDLGIKGVEELRFLIDSITELGLQSASLEIDVTLARGLNYYTGAIFEVTAPDGIKMGSIGGGGRYDDLTSVFGLKDISGVGISFGLDRIYLVLEELGLFKAVNLPKPKVIFLNFDSSTDIIKMNAINKLRAENIKCEFYPDLGVSNKQQKRQWKYISNREIEYVVTKVESNVFSLKNMISNEQFSYSLSELIQKLIY